MADYTAYRNGEWMPASQVTIDISVPGGHEAAVPPQQALKKPSIAQ